MSLFFIDEVAKYRQYDAAGQACNGLYANMFEEEYRRVVGNLQLEIANGDGHLRYLGGISARETHTGYFSIDKRSQRLVDSYAALLGKVMN